MSGKSKRLTAGDFIQAANREVDWKPAPDIPTQILEELKQIRTILEKSLTR